MHAPARRYPFVLATLAVTMTPLALAAQITAADYERATGLRERFEDAGLVMNLAEAPVWLPSGRFWYRTSVPGGNAFVLVDPAAPTKRPAFDHARLATAISSPRRAYAATRLPFTTF